MHAMLQACIDAKTVKRVVLTSSITAVALAGTGPIDEGSWTDVELVRRFNMFLGPYMVTKTLTEKAAFEFAEKHGIDLVSVLPTWISCPFICPNVPDTVSITLGLVLGQENLYEHLNRTSIVHVDDVARAHIHAFENRFAKGRYLCTGVQTSLKDLYEFFSTQYPEFQMPAKIVVKESPLIFSGIPSTKLLESGFKFENGLREIYEGAIKCCREKGAL